MRKSSGPTIIVSLLFMFTVASSVERPFAIHVVDDQTGRGVPLIELRTTGNITFYTDSNGIVAFDEPGLMHQKVFFFVSGHGYEFAADGFGYRGTALDITPGGRARLKVRRLNIAERLYRMTGAGIYRDSMLVGEPVPIRQPLINARVIGSDSVQTVIYRDKIYWFWGDTHRPRYPLGNFHMPGAISALPGQGGLDPDRGVDLTYFVDNNGFARPTAELPGKGPTWLSGLVVIRHGKSKQERLFAHYLKIRNTPTGGFEAYERGLAEFDGEEARFEKVTSFRSATPFPHGGHPLRHPDDGVDYFYYCDPYPLIRVRATAEHLSRQESYESFTPLVAGSTLSEIRLDLDAAGRPRYGWKPSTPPLRPTEQEKLRRDRRLRSEDCLLALRDVSTGKTVIGHRGTVSWNDYRRRWVMIACETFGTSMLGEIWYAEADRLTGPWVYARKVITHDRYSFYNPRHHPFFDANGGRTIYFEGTYTTSFSGNSVKTPRYDYNQIMYRLELTDPRLNLPVAVYEKMKGGVPDDFLTGSDPATADLPVAFWALERAMPNSLPIYEIRDAEGNLKLHAGTSPPSGTSHSRLLCHALPPESDHAITVTLPLHEFHHPESGRRTYATIDRAFGGFTPRSKPLARVWRHPLARKVFSR